MALITVHLYNSNDKAEELIVNTDHIVSVSAANDNSANIQMTSGPVFRTAEGVAELAAIVGGFTAPAAAPIAAPETKSSKKAAPAE